VQAGKQELVLRKQPPGKLLASAHAVHREFAVMKALQSTSVAVPAMLALCKDTSVLGTSFFLMEFVDGMLVLDPNMQAFEAGQRRAAFLSMCGTFSLVCASIMLA
jgi:acyl-CoA dehydrogenase family member 10